MRRCFSTGLALMALAPLLSCRGSSSSVIPATTLGRFASAWLLAHNRGDAHSMVTFTLEHRGQVRMTPFQEDSAVHEGVVFAKKVGSLTPLTRLHSSDTALVVLLRSAAGDTLKASFRPATQPSTTQVVMQIGGAR